MSRSAEQVAATLLQGIERVLDDADAAADLSAILDSLNITFPQPGRITFDVRFRGKLALRAVRMLLEGEADEDSDRVGEGAVGG